MDHNIDNVNHYNKNDVETKDILALLSLQLGDKVSFLHSFYLGNVVKYISRYPYKDNGLEDLKKARTYLDFVIQDMEDGEIWK